MIKFYIADHGGLPIEIIEEIRKLKISSAAHEQREETNGEMGLDEEFARRDDVLDKNLLLTHCIS
jgi:hypothetical protein